MNRFDVARQLVAELDQNGISASITDAGKILLEPAGAASEEIKSRIRAHRDEVVAVLRGEVPEAVHTCWRCGAEPAPPPLDEQIRVLQIEHMKRPELFHWSDREWERLRSLLREGDMLAVAANVYRVVDPNYSGAVVIRDGRFLTIDRRQLMDS